MNEVFFSFHVLVCVFLQILIFLLDCFDYNMVIASCAASLSHEFRFTVWVLSPEKLGKSLFGSAFLKRDVSFNIQSDVVVLILC